MTPDSKRIRSFKDAGAFEAWLSKNHQREPELWLKIHKRHSGLPSVTYAEALEVVLCWGWIDGLRKGFDERSFLQRYTPRKAKSIWSQVNRDHVARLSAAGRMTEHGQRQVDAAKADGRWDAAYAPIRLASKGSLPPDLRKAIDANPNLLPSASSGEVDSERRDIFDDERERAGLDDADEAILLKLCVSHADRLDKKELRATAERLLEGDLKRLVNRNHPDRASYLELAKTVGRRWHLVTL